MPNFLQHLRKSKLLRIIRWNKREDEPIQLNNTGAWNNNLHTAIPLEELIDILRTSSIEKLEPKEYLKIEGDRVIIKRIKITDVKVAFEGEININFDFQSCLFGEFHIHNSRIESQLKFEACYFSDLVFLMASNFKENIFFKDSYFKRLQVQDSSLLDLTIRGNATFLDDIPYLSIINCTFNNLSISNYHYPIYLFLENLTNTGRIEFSTMNLLCFGLKNISNEGKFFSENMKVVVFSIEKLYNYNVFKLNNIRSASFGTTTSVINFQHSHFGEAELLFVDMASFDFQNILFCRLNEVSFINCEWKKEIFSLGGSDIRQDFLERNMNKYKVVNNLEKEDTKKKITEQLVKERSKIKKYHFLQQENYRQLRHASMTTGNAISERYFYSREMRSYRKYLPFWSNMSTVAILGLSSLLSNYGQSLFRPTLSLIIVNLCVFAFFAEKGFIADVHIVHFSQHDWPAFWNATGKFVEFLNPLHKRIEGLPGGYLIFDVFGRIFSSYAVYNVLRATRRFIKKQ